MKIDTLLCTTPEQSRRLLKLGLRPETADCTWVSEIKDYSGEEILEESRNYIFYPEWSEDVKQEGMGVTENLPAWSLLQLTRICPSRLVGGFTKDSKRSYDLIISFIEPAVSYIDKDGIGDEESVIALFIDSKDIYNNMISCIEWLIKGNFINKTLLNL